ncbi:MAG: stomatin-like protein [Candidatus Enteromonas sp.]|jgi:regulator of protease activity HflC (stomatin/prohibitin superfamily)|nr:stomatin-like protein [Candidatus Enteromonas sp.]MEE3431768.1 stomatin-like protein [Candidatus Enteromonas sp.]MEE3442298.1 stomatin-like protein [Candidatus Enteromonas sp.]MEE3464349.1 stomatin-like protein [Candidatus Enteromonas sp.]
MLNFALLANEAASEGVNGGVIAAIIIGVIVFIGIIILISCVKVTGQTEKIIVERLGAYHTTWGTGIHLKAPFVDKIACRIDMKEQVRDFPPQSVITKDNVTMQIDTIVFFQVTDPKLYAYGVQDPVCAIEYLSATTLRNIIGDLDLDATLTSRDIINEKMRKILDEATDPWGIKVNRVEVKNILPPKDIREAMERQMRAEREKREKVLLAEAQKQSAILVAEGNKESMILNAEAEKESTIRKAEGEAQKLLDMKKAEAEGIRLIREAEAEGIKMIREAKPDNAVLTIKGYEALGKVADGKATKIFAPANLANVGSLATAVAEAVKKTEE